MNNKVFKGMNINTFNSNLYIHFKLIFNTSAGIIAFSIITIYALLLTHLNIYFDLVDIGLNNMSDEMVNNYASSALIALSSLTMLFNSLVLVPTIIISKRKNGFSKRMGVLENNWNTDVLQTIASLFIILFSINLLFLVLDYTLLQLIFDFRVSSMVFQKVLATIIPSAMIFLLYITFSMFVVLILRGSWFSILLLFIIIELSLTLNGIYLQDGYGVGNNWRFWKLTENRNILIFLDFCNLSLNPLVFSSVVLIKTFNFVNLGIVTYLYFIIYSLTLSVLMIIAIMKWSNF